jgi:hypothetical protein
MRELTPRDVLIDLFGGADFDHEILDPAASADLVIERLIAAGFAIVDAKEVRRGAPGSFSSSSWPLFRLRRCVTNPQRFRTAWSPTATADSAPSTTHGGRRKPAAAFPLSIASASTHKK